MTLSIWQLTFRGQSFYRSGFRLGADDTYVVAFNDRSHVFHTAVRYFYISFVEDFM